jgi:cold-inducible RNA-binding protein
VVIFFKKQHPADTIGGDSTRKVRNVMGKRLYVGNLPYETTDSELEELFASVGEVDSVRIVNDRDTGRPRGFGFVEMASDADAEKAIQEFNQYELNGRALTVNEARPRRDSGSFGGGGGYRRSEPRW